MPLSCGAIIIAKSENILLPVLVGFFYHPNVCLSLISSLSHLNRLSMASSFLSFRVIPIPMQSYMFAPHHDIRSLCELLNAHCCASTSQYSTNSMFSPQVPTKNYAIFCHDLDIRDKFCTALHQYQTFLVTIELSAFFDSFPNTEQVEV